MVSSIAATSKIPPIINKFINTIFSKACFAFDLFSVSLMFPNDT